MVRRLEPRLQPLDALCASRDAAVVRIVFQTCAEEGIVMDTAVRTVFRPELVESLPTSTTPAPVRMLAVTATYVLSEAGRKASLLAGGNGRAVQHIDIQVPANRLHLVAVNGKGIARLKLRPRFELNREQRIVYIDAPPLFDDLPTLDDLLRVAARNHQLERAYHAERTVNKAKRSEADRARRTEVALAFLRDQTQRAALYPSPNPIRCYVNTPLGRMRFEVDTDEGPARDLVREAFRRFRTDVKADAERRAKDRGEHDRRHEERKLAVDKWVAAHGTEEQKARHAAGLLPIREVIEALTDEAFQALADRPVYVSDGLTHLQDHVRQWTGEPDAAVAPLDFTDSGGLAHAATPAQWARVQEFQATIPDAQVRLHVREYAWKRNASVPRLAHITIIVTKTDGPFTLRREYLMPGEERPCVR